MTLATVKGYRSKVPSRRTDEPRVEEGDGTLKTKFASVAELLFILLATSNVSATNFNSLYAFGDSLSDIGSNPSAILSIYNILGGNCDPGHPCPPYFDGRYSNGPVASEYLADVILPGGGQPANYFSFAVSGSTTGVGNFGDGGNASAPGAFGLPGMAQQLGLYFSSTSVADPDALYLVWGGANDFLTVDSPNLAAQNIASYVGGLAAIDAEHILVPNIPDLSLTPFVQLNPSLASLARGFSLAFNAELASQLDIVSALFPATDIIEYDIFSLFNDVVANPSAYGFSNVMQACLLVACSNPDEFLFWDDFHPTTRGHAIIASEFASAVPVPTTLALMGLGLAVIAWQRRRKPIS